MIHIEEDRFCDLAGQLVLCVSDHGIIVEATSESLYLPFRHVHENEHVCVDTVYKEGDFLSVRVTLKVPLDTFESSGKYRVVPSKYALTSVSDVNLKQTTRHLQWLSWDARHHFCSVCGGALEKAPVLLEKQCTQCKHTVYPNLAPAIIVAITRGDYLLLARSPHFKAGMYSTLAGFVDPGESAEDAVHREIKEEVGVCVRSLRYEGSQSWPFSSGSSSGSFMVAFTAAYDSGDIEVDGHEIEDAQWFHRDALPELPSSASISHALIRLVLLREREG